MVLQVSKTSSGSEILQLYLNDVAPSCILIVYRALHCQRTKFKLTLSQCAVFFFLVFWSHFFLAKNHLFFVL